jgi:hypothetical protein
LQDNSGKRALDEGWLEPAPNLERLRTHESRVLAFYSGLMESGVIGRLSTLNHSFSEGWVVG